MAIAIFILNSCTKENIEADSYTGLNKKTTSVTRKTSTTIDANTNTGLNRQSIAVNNFGIGDTR